MIIDSYGYYFEWCFPAKCYLKEQTRTQTVIEISCLPDDHLLSSNLYWNGPHKVTAGVDESSQLKGHTCAVLLLVDMMAA